MRKPDLMEEEHDNLIEEPNILIKKEPDLMKEDIDNLNEEPNILLNNYAEKKRKKREENIEINNMLSLPKKKVDNLEYNQMILKILENISDSKEFYSNLEKDKKGKINPRIPGIFIIFDNIDFYFQSFQKFKFFSQYTTSIPKYINELKDPDKVYEDIEDYIKENTSILQLINSSKINFNDIVSDYILYFISKKDKLTKDSCEIKHIYKILYNLIEIKKKNEKLDKFKYFIDIIILFNCFSSHITYPLNVIKFLNDEKIVEDIYSKILKEITQYEKESNIIFILIESFFYLLINEILLNNEIISKLNYIHLFLMNIINNLNLPTKSFYIYMQFKSLYNFIQKENKISLLNKVYSEIYTLKDVFIDSNKKDEALKYYLAFYDKLRNDYVINDYKALRIFIVDFFFYELKKYQEKDELFPIIIDVLCEDNGSAFIVSNKLFNIFLKKYFFEKPPKTEDECINILENAYKIMKEKKNDNFEIKVDIEINKNIEEDVKEYDIIKEDDNVNNEEKKDEKNGNNDNEEKKDEENDNDDNEEKKDEKINNENELQPKIINEINEEKEKEIKEDLFLRKYIEIINTKGNDKIKIIIDEIIQQVFGFYFNGYFLSYLDEIDKTNIYKDLDDSKFNYSIFGKNELFFKICIEFLEKLDKSFKGKEISIFLANAFIQSFLYVFIKYFYNNINDNREYIGKYDLDKIFKIIKGRSKFKRVIQIYVFRLICDNMDCESFEEFKKFDVKNDNYKSFVNQFLEEYSFDDPPYQLIFYCKKIFEDFFYNDTSCLPINYQLRGYEFDNMFPYDSNIVNVKMINNNEISSSSINYYENNSHFISRLAILIISNASKDLIGDEQFNKINDEIKNIFKDKNKSINAILNEPMFELIGNLHLNLINELNKILLKNYGDKEEMGQNEDYIPEINSNQFNPNNNETYKYNQRTLGIFLYSLKISLTTFIFDGREKYFYSYLIMTENSSQKIFDILDNSYIPGYDLSKKGLKEQRKDKDYYDNRFDTTISNLTLRFILFSNLLFNILIKKLSDKDINNYSINKNFSCLRMIFYIWNILEKKLINNGAPIIEIYFNLIIKYFPYILKKCTLETIQSMEQTKKFEEEFKCFINACINNYAEYSLNFIDTKMRFIIQETNNPLKYDFDKFPFLTFYSVQSKPNRDDFIKKFPKNDFSLISDNLFNSKIIHNFYQERIILLNIVKYFIKSINGHLILNLKQMEKYKKFSELFFLQFPSDEFNRIPVESILLKIYKGTIKELSNNIEERINYSNSMIVDLIDESIKYDSSYKYLFNEIYEEKEIFNCTDFEFINLDLSKISKYKDFPNFFSNYIYRRNFKSDHSIDYFEYKKFDIDYSELIEHLFSILLYNKKILLELDFSKNIYIPEFDLFNNIYNNKFFLSNYLIQYPIKEELTIGQINNINSSIQNIINNNKIFELKIKLENEFKKQIEKLEKDKENKKKQIDEEFKEENFENKDEMNFIKYEILLDIKKIEKEIEHKQYLIDILNYKYNIVILSLKSNYIIDICFTLQNLLYYIYPINLNEEISLLYICNNLQLFKFEKEKLALLLEQNKELKLSQLFPLYEYFEYLIFPEFIYHINNGYVAQIPLYLAKKILYIFDHEELRSNIIFTKIEFIEAIRKCICRYIVSSVIEDDYITEELNMDLFELLLKEDLWGKNMKIINLKESFNYINNFIKFHLKVKHIFNLFEVLIDIDDRNYLTFDRFKEEEKEDENSFLKFIEEEEEKEEKIEAEIENKDEKEDKEEEKEVKKEQNVKHVKLEIENNDEKEEEDDEEEKEVKKEQKIRHMKPEIENNDEKEEKDASLLSKKEEDFDICDISDDLRAILKNIKRRKNYIYKFIKKSAIIEKYSDIINKKEQNMNKIKMFLSKIF